MKTESIFASKNNDFQGKSIFLKGIPISFRNKILPAKTILGKSVGKIKTAVQEEKERWENTIDQIKTIAIIIAISSILTLIISVGICIVWVVKN